MNKPSLTYMPATPVCHGRVGDILYIVLPVGFGSRKTGRIWLNSVFNKDDKWYLKLVGLFNSNILIPYLHPTYHYQGGFVFYLVLSVHIADSASEVASLRRIWRISGYLSPSNQYLRFGFFAL